MTVCEKSPKLEQNDTPITINSNCSEYYLGIKWRKLTLSADLVQQAHWASAKAYCEKKAEPFD